jgi:hypothetical protein
MAIPHSAIVAENFQAWLEYLSDQVSYAPEADAEMRAQGIPLTDLIAVLEASDHVSSSKENPHDTLFSITGTTVDNERLFVTLSIDPILGACVHGVQRL